MPSPASYLYLSTGLLRGDGGGESAGRAACPRHVTPETSHYPSLLAHADHLPILVPSRF